MSTKTETAIVEIVLKGQQANSSLKDIEKAARALRAQLSRLPVDSQEFIDRTREFQRINERLTSIRNDVNGVGGVFGRIGNEIRGFGLLAAGYLGFDWLKSSISGIIKSNAELSDSLADIRKTTGMTDEEARKLNTSLSQINTRTAASELRNIAIAGGQLGIAKGDILKFTTAVDKMNVALGDEFTGGAEEVTKAMGGLRNTFTDIKSDRVDEDLLHIGNAINALASSGAATGPVISDFANRIGGVGITLGLTSDQVLGLSATLQELQVNQERGGTAVSKILQKMTTNTAEFAKVAGVPIQKFTNMVNNDLYGAFLKVVEGSKKGGASATSFGKILDDLGVDGAGASEVFAKLSNNTGLLSEKVALAGNSLKSTDSIMAEFNIKNSTLAAEMERLSKGFSSAFTNSTISNGLKATIGLFADLFDKTKKASEVTREERDSLMLAETEIFSYNVGNEKRTKLIKELQDKYPEYLQNINAETIGNNELHNALDKVNASLINKIVIQKKDEEIQELAEKAADKKLAASEAKLKLIQSLTDAYNSNARAIKFSKEMEGLPIEVQAQEISKPENFQKAGLSAYNTNILEIQANLAKWKKLEAEVSGASIPLNDVLNEKTELMKMLGIETKKTTEILKKSKDSPLPLDEKTLNELEAAYKKYQDDLFKLEEDFNNRHQSQDDKAKQAIYDKYKVFLAAEKEGSEAYKNLIFKRDTEIEEFENKKRAKYLSDRQEANEKIKRITQSSEQNEIDDVNKKFNELTDIAISFEIDTVALEEARQLALLAVRQKYNQAEIDEAKVKNDKIEATEKSFHKSRVKLFEQWTRQASQIIKEFNAIQNNNENKELEKEKAQNEVKKLQFKRLLDSKIISQREYDKRVNKLDAERDAKELEIKKKQAQRERNAALVMVAINTAVAISEASPNYVSMALAAVLGAIQIAAISSQPAAYAKGGFNSSNDPQGMVNSPTYFTNSSSGKDFIAGEKGAEWIAPNWMLQNPATANTIGMLEAIRQRGYASGGFNTAIPKMDNTTSTSKNNVNTSFVSNDTALVDAINNLNSILQNGINANLNYDQFNKDMSAINSARSSAQVKN